MKTLLVIPCYYESKRLPGFLPRLCELLSESDLAVEVLLVDDGSSKQEQEELSSLHQDLKEKYSFLRSPLLLEANVGKGGAVRAGWDSGKDVETLAFVDADGAAPAEETVRFLNQIQQNSDSKRMLIATREPGAGRRLERKFSRKVVAWLFNRLIRLRYDIQVPDTQCGLKAVPTAFFNANRDRLVQAGYAFDLELILAAMKHGLSIETLPIDWKEIPGSSTNAKHALAFVKQILFRKI